MCLLPRSSKAAWGIVSKCFNPCLPEKLVLLATEQNLSVCEYINPTDKDINVSSFYMRKLRQRGDKIDSER